MRGERKGDTGEEKNVKGGGSRGKNFPCDCAKYVKKRNGKNWQSKQKQKRKSRKKGKIWCWERNLWNRLGGGTVDHEEISALLTKRSLFSLCQTAGQDPGRSLYKQKRETFKKQKKMNVRCEWIFHEASIVVVPSSFPFAYKNNLPTLTLFRRGCRTGSHTYISIHTKKIDSRSAKIQENFGRM